MPALLPRQNAVETYPATGASKRGWSASSGVVCSVGVSGCAVLLCLLDWTGLSNGVRQQRVLFDWIVAVFELGVVDTHALALADGTETVNKYNSGSSTANLLNSLNNCQCALTVQYSPLACSNVL